MATAPLTTTGTTENSAFYGEPVSFSGQDLPHVEVGMPLELTFRRTAQAGSRLLVPRGTRVATERGGADGPVFVTSQDLVLEAGQREASVVAHHGETVDGELVGRGTSVPGQSVRSQRRSRSIA